MAVKLQKRRVNGGKSERRFLYRKMALRSIPQSHFYETRHMRGWVYKDLI